MSNNKKDRPNLYGWLNLGSSVFGSVANVVSQAIANAKNERLEAARNAMQVAENEKAYNRSKATHQAMLMQQAGMSKAGALNAINGGGSYTPASMTTAQVAAPQVDLSSAFNGLITIGENAKQRAAQERLQAQQLQAAKDMQQAQIESTERQHRESLASQESIADKNRASSENMQDKMLSWEKEKYNNLPEYDKERYRKAYELLEKQTELADWQVNDLKYRILEYQSAPYKSTRDSQNLLQDIAATFDANIEQRDLNWFKDSYMYFDPNDKKWHYKEPNKVGQYLLEKMPLVWELASRVLPAEQLANIIAKGLGKK